MPVSIFNKNETFSFFKRSNMSSIDDIKSKFAISVGVSFIIFGTVGNVLNMILLRKRTLWTLSPCVPLLFAVSVSNLILIYCFVTIRLLVGFRITPTFYSTVVCKLHLYLYYLSYCLSSWFMVACCIDRFLSSSDNIRIRKYSNRQTITRSGYIITVIILVVFSPILYCFEAQQFDKSTPCYPRDDSCGMIELVLYFIFQGIGPPVLMFFFGIGTIKHIHRVLQDHQVSSFETRRTSAMAERRKKISLEVLRMISVQVLFYFISAMPLLTIKIYASIPLSIVKSSIQLSFESLVANVCLLITCVDKVFSFYIYTLASKYYRKQLLQLFLRYWHRQRITPQN